VNTDLIIDGMSEKDEDTVGGEIRINANHDEHNGDTTQLEDFRNDGIVANDLNLLSGQLDITGARIKGKYHIIYPQDKIIVWQYTNDGGAFSKVTSVRKVSPGRTNCPYFTFLTSERIIDEKENFWTIRNNQDAAWTRASNIKTPGITGKPGK